MFFPLVAIVNMSFTHNKEQNEIFVCTFKHNSNALHLFTIAKTKTNKFISIRTAYGGDFIMCRVGLKFLSKKNKVWNIERTTYSVF